MNNVEMNAKTKLQEALSSDDEKVKATAVAEYIEGIAKELEKKFEDVKDSQDANVLASRGFRALTSKEREYFEKLGKAIERGTKEAITNIDVVLPTTTIDRVFEDLTTNHPLLQEIDMRNVTGLVEIITNTGEAELAVWGPLCAEITKELGKGLHKESTQLYKLSAFIPVCKAYLTLGPVWLEAFVRAILTEAISSGLENAIINGTGNNQPIGMDKDLDGAVTGGVYTAKTAVEMSDLTPKTIYNLVADLTNGGKRTVNEIIMIVNPVDYWRKIKPAITITAFDGSYKEVIPFPIKFIQSQHIAQNKAIAGLGKRYLMGMGMNQKIEYSDEVHFLEDERVYVGKLYGMGKPVDNNSFIVLDITDLSADEVEVTPAG